MRIYTIGHSTRSFEEFLRVLKQYGIRCLMDVRRFPSSKKFPHFNRGELETSLMRHGIRYVWMEQLGGRRHGATAPDSPNTGLRSLAFRNYADHMQTEEFRAAMDALVTQAENCPTAIMCAEKLHFRCHRILISDYLTAIGIEVLHIGTSASGTEDSPIPHTYTSCARVEDGKLTYPGVPL